MSRNKIIKRLLKIFGIKPYSINSLRKLYNEESWIILEKNGRKLLANNSHHEEALGLVSYSLLQQGNFEESINFAKKALEISPNQWLPLFTMVISLSSLERENEEANYLKNSQDASFVDEAVIIQTIKNLASLNYTAQAISTYNKYSHLITKSPGIVLTNINSVRNWSKELGMTLLEPYEIEEIPFKEPNVFDTTSHSTEVSTIKADKPYIADLKDVRIFGNSSIILTNNNTALIDLLTHNQLGPCVDLKYDNLVLAQGTEELLLNFSTYKTNTIEAGVFMSGLFSNQFGHWLPDFLPKIQFYKEHPDFQDLSLIVDSEMPQSHFDHLQRICRNKLVLLHPDESFICKRLLTASSPMFLPPEYFAEKIPPAHEKPGLSPRAMRFLQGDNLNKNDIVRDKRIFLSRKNMRWRRLINESEIIADLSKFGFETIYLEEMTANEQIELFQHTSWIVAPNGSALLNIIFANIDIKLLVLLQPDVHDWGTFQGPIDSLGYKSICVCGDYASDNNQKHTDYHVPLDKIHKALTYLGMNLPSKLTTEEKF